MKSVYLVDCIFAFGCLYFCW